MIVKSLEAGPLMVNCYIIADDKTGQAMVVDPGGSAQEIAKFLKDSVLTCQMIVNTHTHWDHIGGNSELKEITDAQIITHEKEAPMLQNASVQGKLFGINVSDSPPADKTVAEGDVLTLGEMSFRVIELPGHSPCGVGLVFADEKDDYVIVGDSLFAGSIGRTDFPGGDYNLLLQVIRDKIFTLPDQTIVLPGHGPATTVEREKRFNPFF